MGQLPLDGAKVKVPDCLPRQAILFDMAWLAKAPSVSILRLEHEALTHKSEVWHNRQHNSILGCLVRYMVVKEDFFDIKNAWSIDVNKIEKE